GVGAAAVLAFALGVAFVLGLGAEVAASGFGLRRVLPFSSTQVAVAVVPVVGLVMGCPSCCPGRAGGGFRGAAPLAGSGCEDGQSPQPVHRPSQKPSDLPAFRPDRPGLVEDVVQQLLVGWVLEGVGLVELVGVEDRVHEVAVLLPLGGELDDRSAELLIHAGLGRAATASGGGGLLCPLGVRGLATAGGGLGSGGRLGPPLLLARILRAQELDGQLDEVLTLLARVPVLEREPLPVEQEPEPLPGGSLVGFRASGLQLRDQVL